MLRLILDGQNVVVAKLDSVEAKMLSRMDAHADSDVREFKAIRDEIGNGLGGLRDRVVRIESVSDTVDSLTDTAMDHEHRLGTVETERKTAINWAQWLITTLIALGTAIATAWAVKH